MNTQPPTGSVILRALGVPQPPPGRRMAVSLSGTERTDWKVGAGLALVAAFGLGMLIGRRSSSGDEEYEEAPEAYEEEQ